MRYWNKNKKARDHWTLVTFPVEDMPSSFAWYAPAGLMRGVTSASKHFSFSKEAKLWCQNQPGRGRFYYGPYTGLWWFEFSEDALAFKLKWTGPN
jgi:hypothetical protein